MSRTILQLKVNKVVIIVMLQQFNCCQGMVENYVWRLIASFNGGTTE